MATSTIFNFNFNNSEIVDSTGQWYDATTGTPTTEFIEHDGNTALLQRAYIAETSYLRDINPVFFQSRDPTFTAHTYTIELQIYPLRDSGGFGPWDGPVLDFNPTESDEEGWVKLRSVQRGSESNTFYWREYGLGPDGTGIPFLTVTAADGTYNRWYSIRIERVDDGANTGATIKIYVDGTLVVNETLTYAQDARRGRISDSVRYTYRRNSTSPGGAGVAIDNFKLTAGIAPSSVVDVSLANLQRNNANLLSFIKGKVPTVNDGTLTIKVNGATAGTFTANASTNATANITVPTAVSELTNDSGYLTASSNLDASKLTSGTVDIERLPQGALERLVKVANEAARYALTTADVQLGDTVQQLDTGIMYVVTDTDHLDSAAGYTEYTAGTAASVPWSGVTGKPTFAAVATSGAYSDLTGTPTIPTVNNATLTIQKNGTTVKTFTANQSTNATANITVPTKTSDLTNDSGFVASADLSAVATSGSYNDLSNKPTIPTVNNATLTIQQNGTNVQTFTANQSTAATANIRCVDLSTAQTVAGVKTFSDGLCSSRSTQGDLAILEDNSINSANEDANGMPLIGHTNSLKIKGSQSNVLPCMLVGAIQTSGTTSAELRVYKYKDLNKRAGLSIYYDYVNDKAYAQLINCDITPNAAGLYDIGSSVRQFNNAYIKSLTINGTAAGDILTHNASEFASVNSLAAVATSGNYNDLSNKPTIPTVNNATLTIQKNGTTVKTFTANASSNVTANITVPTKTSDLTNDSNFVASTDLATVATSGSYNDLSNKPTIPTVNNATLTIKKNGTTVKTFTANASSNVTANITVPTKTSDLTNDSGFITSDNTKIPLSGSNQISGDLIPATDNSIDVGSSSKNIKMLYTKGITIDGTQFLPSDYVPRSGGAVMTGNRLGREVDTGMLIIDGGEFWNHGASVAVYGKYSPDGYGMVWVHPSDGSDEKSMQLKPNGTWTWEGQAVQLISDQRLKQQIAEIDDKLLDAWEDVNLVQFKYNDAVDQKKDNARLHTGYVVQQIDKACKSHNVDISKYGLYCHEEYPQETEEVEVEQADGTKTKETRVIREANEHYSLRYTEALIVECKYLRRCIARLTARIEELEKGKEQEASK